jgi:hypothetical protein
VSAPRRSTRWRLLPWLIGALLGSPAALQADALQDCLDSVEVTSDCLGRRLLESTQRLEAARAEAKALAQRRDEEAGDGAALGAMQAGEDAFDAWVQSMCLAYRLLGGDRLPVEPDDLQWGCTIDLIEQHADALELLGGEGR